MAEFRIQHAPPFEQTGLGFSINDQYFTVDTAERATIDAWKRKNPHYLTYAFWKNEFMGFIGILPLTKECGVLFERQEILEEEITDNLVLSPEAMQHTQYLYITSIAVEKLGTYRSKQAAAALVSCGAGMIRNLYGSGRLKKIFANPTTYHGNRIIGKFGLLPMSNFKKPLKAGNDIYTAEVNDDYMRFIRGLEHRYQRFILDYPWPLT